mmetsp:Transcript_301/g.585  ORF Transcript_301/g.585 Transcript_301/m.585 type:complete len:90 (+) Transcript_301:322-591(+)
MQRGRQTYAEKLHLKELPSVLSRTRSPPEKSPESALSCCPSFPPFHVSSNDLDYLNTLQLFREFAVTPEKGFKCSGMKQVVEYDLTTLA